MFALEPGTWEKRKELPVMFPGLDLSLAGSLWLNLQSHPETVSPHFRREDLVQSLDSLQIQAWI